MGSLFDLWTSLDGVVVALLLIGIAFLLGLGYTYLVSLKLKASKSFFLTSALMPLIVASVISMVSLFLDSSTTGAVRIATIAVALGLIRFRSVNGRAEELLVLFGGVAIGLIAGLGYAVIAAIIALALALLFLGLSASSLFEGKRHGNEKLLRITVPEDLDYQEAVEPVLGTYAKAYELMGIKTTGMGSLFRLSYKVELPSRGKEKEFLDELRLKNANLEISLTPYVEGSESL